MTPDEVLVLLQVAQSYDNRNIDRIMQSSWIDAAHRARWDHVEAVTAVRTHYAESTDWILPGHVTARIKAAAKAPGYAPTYRPALSAAPPATEEQRAAARELFAPKGRTREPRKAGLRRRRHVEGPTMSESGDDPVRALSGDLGQILDRLLPTRDT